MITGDESAYGAIEEVPTDTIGNYAGTKEFFFFFFFFFPKK